MKEASSGRLLGRKGQMECAHKMSVPPNRKIRRGTPYFEATYMSLFPSRGESAAAVTAFGLWCNHQN